MTTFLIAATATALGVAFVILLLPQTAGRQQAVLVATSREVGLGLSPQVETVVLGRSRRAQRLSFVGGVLGWACSVWVLPPPAGSTTGVWLILGSIVLGGALGNLAAAVLDARAPHSSAAPRIARGIRVTIEDYISPIERSFGWVAAGAVVAGAAVCALAGVHDLLLLIALPGLVAVLWGVGAVGGRFVISQRQYAVSNLELAWNDALRAKNLRALLQAAPVAALYGAIAMIGTLDPGGRQIGWQVLVALVALLPPIVVVLLPGRRSARGSRYYLQRLWPETAEELARLERIAT